MNWDSIIGFVIVVFFILIIWARVSKQTVVEVIGDIKDMISGGKDEVEEQVEGVTIYE
jgi:hypothetical protein